MVLTRAGSGWIPSVNDEWASAELRLRRTWTPNITLVAGRQEIGQAAFGGKSAGEQQVSAGVLHIAI
jgi:hypothetical protein